MKRNLRIIIRILVAVIFVLCIYSTNSNAYYQSKPNATQLNKRAQFWMDVRYIEYPNYGMGLTEKNINGTNLLSGTPNNIDAHMMKNTEYGAMVLLGASDYGKQGTGTAKYMQNGTGDQVTTTGNYTGVYGVGTGWEWTASSGINYCDDDSTTKIINAAGKYRNVYGEEKRGDATSSTARWQGATSAGWVGGWSIANFARGGNGAFSYNGEYYSNNYPTRAVVVNGNNF